MHSVKWADFVETLESFMHCIAVSVRPLLSFSPAPSFYPSFVACIRIFRVDWHFSSCLLFWFVDLSFSPKIIIIQGKLTTVGFLLPPAFPFFFWKKKKRSLLPIESFRTQETSSETAGAVCFPHSGTVQGKPRRIRYCRILGIYPGFGLLMAVRWLWNFYMCSEKFWKFHAHNPGLPFLSYSS